jgi:hypothetical protein
MVRRALAGGYLGGVASLGASEIQAAYNAAIGGDLDPLVSLFDPDLDWRGLQRGHLWWRHTPA